MANTPITVLLYNGPLLCSFNVVLKGLGKQERQQVDTLLAQVNRQWFKMTF